MSKKVSIIISNRNDTVMLSITVRSCLEELRFLGKNAEIIIVDNSDKKLYNLLASVLPTGYCREGLLKVYRQENPCLFSARKLAAEKSSGEYIMCLDSHMIVGHNCIEDLVRFMDSRKDDKTLGFAHAPINWLHHHEMHARHDRDMRICELGDWNTKYDHVRTITWKGMPWICRRDWFLDRDKGLGDYGALADHEISWGGGDMHLGVKTWMLGFKNWAVPTSPCHHIGPFPKVEGMSDQYKYRLYGNSGNHPHTFGFLVSCYILGGVEMIERNRSFLTRNFGQYLCIDENIEAAKEIGKDERAWLIARRVVDFETLVRTQPWNQ